MEFNVATIFWAIIPDLPSPVTITLPLHLYIISTASENVPLSLFSRRLNALRSICITRFASDIALFFTNYQINYPEYYNYICTL